MSNELSKALYRILNSFSHQLSFSIKIRVYVPTNNLRLQILIEIERENCIISLVFFLCVLCFCFRIVYFTIFVE